MSHKIAVMAGDGIGREVMPEGLRVLKIAAERFGIALDFKHFDFASCDYYREHGKMLPDDWRDTLGGFDALFYGAVGWPDTVPDHVSLWGSLLQFRRGFDQYINLRPCRSMPGIKSPLADRQPGDIDFYVVRENTEGEYSSIGGRMFEGTEREVVIQETVMSRIGIDRVLKYAFELAARRPRHKLTSATKSNGISITMPYWDERVAAMARTYPDVTVDKFHIDILAANFVLHPDWFDVVVGSNLFGDILSDLGPGVYRHHRRRALGQHQPRGSFPQPVRAGPRQRAGHRRARHRQPHRPDLVRRDDARAPRPRGRRPGDRRRHRGGARRGAAAGATDARSKGQRQHRSARQGDRRKTGRLNAIKSPDRTVPQALSMTRKRATASYSWPD